MSGPARPQPSRPAGGPEGDGRPLRTVLLEVSRQLGSASEARWLVEHVAGPGSHAQVLAGTGAALDADADAELQELVRRRLAGEPVQYLLGRWPFRQLQLAVDRRVLIPRPETEVVTGHALDELVRAAGDIPADAFGDDPVRVADLGTGSGAIALSLALEAPRRLTRRLQVWATDLSPEALAVAGVNEAAARAEHRAMAPVTLSEGSWFDALPAELAGTFTLVVSNPPYVTEAEWSGLDRSVRDHEPRQALVGGPRGVEQVDHILGEAPRWLARWGVLVLELAPHQADDAALRALVAGFDAVVVRRDLAGRQRALIARWPDPEVAAG